MGLLGGLSQRVFEWTGIPVHRLLLQANGTAQESRRHPEAIDDRSWSTATTQRSSSSSSKRGWREETRQVLRVHQVLETLDGEREQEEELVEHRQRVSPPRNSRKRSGGTSSTRRGSR